MDYIPINWGLIKNPINWFIIFFMVTLLQIPLFLVHDKIIENNDPSTGS